MIHRSREPDVVVPDATLTEFVLGDAERHGDRTALVDAGTGESLSYRQLARQVRTGAAGLVALGVRPGDVVAVVSHNQPRYAVAVHAAIAAGAAVTPINPVLTAEEIAGTLRLSRASVVITAEPVASKVDGAARAVGLPHRYVLGDAPDLRPWDELAGSGPDAPLPRPDPATALAALPFSSGTTGLPKGVMLTHRNLVANIAQNDVGWPLGPDDVLAAAMPFFHIYGFTIILNSGLRAGATLVTMARFDLPGWLELVQRHRVSHAFLAPPVVLALATAPEVDAVDLSSLRRVVCGAAPLDIEVARRAERRLGCVIRQGYGMTEASPGTHLVPHGDGGTRADAGTDGVPPDSVGRLIPSTEARLVDPDTLADVPAGRTGELWVRGPQVMAGYLDDPAATAATLVDGWLRTGDLVRIDDDEVFRVVDRLKELIKYKGYQVAPAELEAVLLGHPAVRDAAVIGVPDEAGGEAPKAFVVADGDLDPDALMAWVAERVAPYKKVRQVQFVAEVPKSPTGKILRRLLG